MAKLVRRLAGVKVEAAPSVAVLSDAAERRAALAAEEDRQVSSAAAWESCGRFRNSRTRPYKS